MGLCGRCVCLAVRVTIHSIHIQNDLKLPNNDGIDLDAAATCVSATAISSVGMICICLKPALRRRVTDVRECDGDGLYTGVNLNRADHRRRGSEPMRNIVFNSCVIRSSHRGLAIHLSEESDIENVLFSNIIVETRIFHEGLVGRGDRSTSPLSLTNEHKIGHVRNIRFSNISVEVRMVSWLKGGHPVDPEYPL